MLNLHQATIFVSYSHKDTVFASKLVSDLRDFGCEVWIDEKDMVVGDSIPKSVKRGISRSRFFLVIISAHSAKSNWVRAELMEAKRKGKAILPITIGGQDTDVLLSRLPDKLYVDFENIQYEDGLDMIIRRLSRRPSLSIRRIILLASVLVLLFLAFGSAVGYMLLWKERVDIEDVQRRVQLIDDGMTRGDFFIDIDRVRRSFIYRANDGHMVGCDTFDPTTRRIITRSYYDESGNRIAIDRFEWYNGSAIKKLRVHFDENRDEFVRESFSLTGKLERKEYDKYRNGNFIEREADFVSPFPGVFFPIFYR